MIPIAFFNNKGGVGKTALASHIAWMFADRGIPVLAADLDPQSNLSSMLLSDERLQDIWRDKKTILASIRPLVDRLGDVGAAHAEPVAPNLHVLVGDLGMSRFEDLLAENWSKCLTGEVGAFRVMSAFHRIVKEASTRVGAEVVVLDLGPNLGPLNRAALLASDNIVLPIAPDLFSIQGMENLGPTLSDWRRGWRKRVEEVQDKELDLPSGTMAPIGYVIMNFGVRDSRPVQAYEAWIERVPQVYREMVLGEHGTKVPSPDRDPFRLAALKHYRSLMPLAMSAHKPMFMLKTADGARGAHLDAVRACYKDFLALTQRIGSEIGIAVP